MQFWKPGSLIFAKRPNVKCHCAKISKSSFGNVSFLTQILFAATMIANLEPTPENFQQKGSFFRSRSTKGVKRLFQKNSFLSIVQQIHWTRRVHFWLSSEGDSSKRLKFFRWVCDNDEKMFLERKPLPQVVDLAIKIALLKSSQKNVLQNPENFQLKVGRWWKRFSFSNQKFCLNLSSGHVEC